MFFTFRPAPTFSGSKCFFGISLFGALAYRLSFHLRTYFRYLSEWDHFFEFFGVVFCRAHTYSRASIRCAADPPGEKIRRLALP